MTSKGSRNDRGDAAAASDGVIAEPSEARLRNFLLTAALLVVPIVLAALYFRIMFPGLTNPDALDLAQLGRNMSSGRGFVTNILLPYAMPPGTEPVNLTRQPELLHGPAYPFVLALAFGALGTKDAVPAWVSALFYVLTVPVLYVLGTRVFNRTVGLIAVLVFAFNARALEYSASGLHVTLYVFLTTCLLLVLYNLAAHRRDRPEAGPPRAQLVLAGILTGTLYLTDSLFFWIIPVVIGAVLWLHPTRRLAALGTLMVPLGLLTLPWMARNWMLAGNPVFALRGLELFTNTIAYPGDAAYRLTPADVTPGMGLFQGVVKKILLNFGQLIEALPGITGSWVLAFFLPSLLFRFSDPAVTTVRNALILCFVGITIGTLLFGVSMPLFVSVIPSMLVFAAAFLMHLGRQARLSRPGAVLAGTVLTVAVVFPLVKDMALIPKATAVREAAAARTLGAAIKQTPGTDVILSDQPWITAWYAECPTLWIPASDETTLQLTRGILVSKPKWLFLTQRVQAYSWEWAYVYDRFLRWNTKYKQALLSKSKIPDVESLALNRNNRTPLAEALDGTAVVGLGPNAPLMAVVAEMPRPASNVGFGGEQPRAAGTSRSGAVLVK